MDVIWVPDSGSSASTDSPTGGAGLQTIGNLALCVVGFLILAGGAIGSFLLVDSSFVQYARKSGMDWTLELWPVIPCIGYLLTTTGALRRAFAAKASPKRRWAWFAVSQAVAAGLLYAGMLHQAL